MKKSKIALAAVVATALGVSALGLAACTDENGNPVEPKGVYTITFDANGGTYASPVKRPTLDGKLKAFPATNPTAPDDDSVFKGWALSPTATEADKLSLSHEYKEDTTVYAIWGGEVEQETGAYLISFDPNGGTITSGESEMTTVNGILASLPTASNGAKGFLGWYIVKNSTDETKKIVANKTIFTEPQTVYASWADEVVQEHDITFDANGGKIAGEDTKTLTTVGGVIADLPTPELPGSVFLGWYTQSVGGTRITKISVFDETTTVYAHWDILTANNYIVGGKTYNLTDREGWLDEQPDDRDRMYSIGSIEEPGVDLEPGDEISFKIDGEPIVFFVTADSKGVAEAGTSTEVSKITINAKKAANFVFYLAHYPAEGRDKANWSVTVVADLGDDPIVTPDGATATIGDTTKEMTALSFTEEEMEENGYKDVELQLLNETIAEGTEISFTYNGEEVSFGWYRGDSAATSATLTSGKTTSITTLAGGKYSIYLQHYTADNNEGEHWYIVAKLDVKQTGLTASTALTANDWYLTGDMTEFGGLYDEYKMSENNGQIEWEGELPAYTSLKLVNGDKTKWVGEYKMWAFEEDANADYMIKGSNVTILQAGKYGFYYNVADKLIYVSRITEGGGGGQQQTDKAPGLYVGDTKLQAWASHDNPDEVKLINVQIAPDSTLTFVYGKREVVPTIKEYNGSLCTDKIVLKNGALYCANGGTFDMYYEFGTNKIWIEYKGQYTEPETDLGGLAINGEVVHAFILNEDGFNEVWLGDADITLEQETEFTVMYGGVDVTAQVTIKDGSIGSIKNGKLVVPAGSFKFYYDYAAKAMYIGGKVVSSIDPQNIVLNASEKSAVFVFNNATIVIKLTAKASWGTAGTEEVYIGGDWNDKNNRFKLDGKSVYTIDANLPATLYVGFLQGNDGKYAAVKAADIENEKVNVITAVQYDGAAGWDNGNWKYTHTSADLTFKE